MGRLRRSPAPGDGGFGDARNTVACTARDEMLTAAPGAGRVTEEKLLKLISDLLLSWNYERTMNCVPTVTDVGVT